MLFSPCFEEGIVLFIYVLILIYLCIWFLPTIKFDNSLYHVK